MTHVAARCSPVPLETRNVLVFNSDAVIAAVAGDATVRGVVVFGEGYLNSIVG